METSHLFFSSWGYTAQEDRFNCSVNLRSPISKYLFLFVIITLVLFSTSVHAAANSEYGEARILKGKMIIVRNGQTTSFEKSQKDISILFGDVVRAGDDTRISITNSYGQIVVLNSNGVLNVKKWKIGQNQGDVSLLSGKFKVQSVVLAEGSKKWNRRKKAHRSTFRLRTATAIIGVKGSIVPDLDVSQNKVNFSNGIGDITSTDTPFDKTRRFPREMPVPRGHRISVADNMRSSRVIPGPVDSSIRDRFEPQKTTQADGTVIEIDASGTKTEARLDGTSTSIDVEGNKTEAKVVSSSDSQGNKVVVTEKTISKTVDGKVVTSTATEKVVVKTDGSKSVESVATDGDGKKTIVVKETKSDGSSVTEKITRNAQGEETTSSKETVTVTKKADGTRIAESQIVASDGSKTVTVEKTATDGTKKIETETVSGEGNVTKATTTVVESADGSKKVETQVVQNGSTTTTTSSITVADDGTTTVESTTVSETTNDQGKKVTKTITATVVGSGEIAVKADGTVEVAAVADTEKATETITKDETSGKTETVIVQENGTEIKVVEETDSATGKATVTETNTDTQGNTTTTVSVVESNGEAEIVKEEVEVSPQADGTVSEPQDIKEEETQGTVTPEIEVIALDEGTTVDQQTDAELVEQPTGAEPVDETPIVDDTPVVDEEPPFVPEIPEIEKVIPKGRIKIEIEN